MKYLFLSMVLALGGTATAQGDSQLDYCNEELPKLFKEDTSWVDKLKKIDKLARDDHRKFQKVKSSLKGAVPELDRLSAQPDSERNDYNLVINGYFVKQYDQEIDPNEQGSVSDNIKEYFQDKMVAGKFVAAGRSGNFAQEGAKVAKETNSPNFFRALQTSADVGADAELQISTSRIGSTSDGAKLAGRAQKNTYLGNLERGRWKLEENRISFQKMIKRQSVEKSTVKGSMMALINHYHFAERAIKESITAFRALGLIHQKKAVCMRAMKRAGEDVEQRMKSLGQ